MASLPSAPGAPGSRLDELLASNGARALVVLARSSRDPWLARFVGPVKLGPSFVVAKPGAAPRLAYWTPMERDEARKSGLELLTPEALDVVRWARDAASPAELLANTLERAFHLCEIAPGTVAAAGLAEAGRWWEAGALLARDGWSFVSGEPIVLGLRREKTAAELDEMRRVAAVTGDAFRRLAGLLAASESRGGEIWLGAERLRIGRLQAEIHDVISGAGLEQPEGGICAPGEEGAVPHNPGSPERVLRAGESLVVDLYPRSRLFADITRTFCVGEAPPALREAHARVREALELARREARAGVRGWTIQERVCEHFAAAGYKTPIQDRGTTRGYVHGLGHDVGYEVHEDPSFKEEVTGPEGTLAAGDVVTLEPGLYEPEEGWAVRLEDLCIVGEAGAEVLGPLPYDLDPRAWSASR